MTPNPSDAAREALELIGRALPADGRVELALAAGHLPERTATARIVAAGPGELGRLLRPPSADALGEACAFGTAGSSAAERLEASAQRARAAAGEEVCGTWRVYMVAARRGFEEGVLDVAQLLLARPLSNGPAGLPLRPWWHE